MEEKLKSYSDSGMPVTYKASKILHYYTGSNIILCFVAKNMSLLGYSISLWNLENYIPTTYALFRSTLYKIHFTLQYKDITWSLEPGILKYKNHIQQIL